MGHRVFIKSLVVLLMVLVCGCSTTQPTNSMGGSVSSVETIVFDAPSVGRSMRFSLVLPKDYGQSEKRYPVLYLLHGYGGYHEGWIQDGAAEYAAAYDLIVVVPDAGNSWYVNWAVSENGEKNNWEDYIVKDVVGYVDSHYLTISRRKGRAIGGLSMGGYGAMVVGLRNPEMFCSVASHSGALSYGGGLRENLRRRGRCDRRIQACAGIS